jgi:hypothetical protein
MARTKAGPKRGTAGREYRKSMNTPEGREWFKQNRKMTRGAQKAAEAGKEEPGPEGPGSLSRRQKKALKRRQQTADLTDVAVPEDPSTPQFTADALPTTTTTASSDARPALNELESEYEFTSINIISSSHIQQKVTQALGVLSVYPVIPPAKPAVLILHSKAPVAVKLITIAEITKREIGRSGGKWFQYNKLDSVVEEKKVYSKGEKGEKANAENTMNSLAMEVDGEGDPESEGEAFETMETPFERAIEGRPKIRSVPVMTLYLSRVRVDSLRKLYG